MSPKRDVALVATAIALGVTALFACGSRPSTPSQAHAQTGSPASAASSADAGADARPASGPGLIDRIAENAHEVAPGMSNVMSDELDVTGTVSRPIVSADARDLCVRVMFVASTPVHGVLEDRSGAVLAETTASDRGLLGERGPVCVRRGDAVQLRIDASSHAHVGFVAWASQ